MAQRSQPPPCLLGRQHRQQLTQAGAYMSKCLLIGFFTSHCGAGVAREARVARRRIRREAWVGVASKRTGKWGNPGQHARTRARHSPHRTCRQGRRLSHWMRSPSSFVTLGYSIMFTVWSGRHSPHRTCRQGTRSNRPL